MQRNYHERSTNRRSKKKTNILGKEEQLCWSCKKSLLKCPWSINFTPIKGWDAEETGNGSYRIYNCPLFENDMQEDEDEDKSHYRKAVLLGMMARPSSQRA